MDKITPEQLNKMSLVKQTVVSQLLTLTQVAQMSPDSFALAALIHAVVGVALLDKEEVLLTEIRPLMETITKEALELLKEVTVRRAEEAGETPATEENFFDKNEIIH
jgi:hypothetical protein